MNIDERIARDRETIRRTIGALIPPGTKCALAGYPDHWNVGDCAIWWGTQRLLDEMDVRVVYSCAPSSYDPSLLAKALPSGPILILGGGNWGDVYVIESGLRQRILNDFSNRRIIQLPQSIWYRDAANIEPMNRLLVKQSDFTLLVRDRESHAFAINHLAAPVKLCPDLGLCLPNLAAHCDPPSHDIFALMRNDDESLAGESAKDLPGRDWIACGPETSRMSRHTKLFLRLVGERHSEDGYHEAFRRFAWRHVAFMWNALARERTIRGCRLLSQGKVIVTDRLHAHLLCLQMNKPHVVVDSVNGKIGAYMNTWPTDDQRIRRATDQSEAVVLAREVLGAINGNV